MSNLGILLRRSGKFEESQALHEECLRLRKEVLGSDHFDTLTSMANLGLTHLDAGNSVAGIQLLEEFRAAIQNAAELSWIRNELADVYASEGKLSQAIGLTKEQIEAARKSLPVGGQRFATVLATCGLRLLKLEVGQEAEPILRECLTLREELSPGTRTTFNARSMLGEAVLGQQRNAEAESLLLDGYAGLLQQVDSITHKFKSNVRLAIERLIRLYEATENRDEAERWKAEREAASGLGDRLSKGIGHWLAIEPSLPLTPGRAL